ncbi:MAG: hydantoinase/oxoprolinase family protein, partial [Bacteroidota bacterium]
MTSAAGLVSAAHFHAKDSLLSGPAGGVLGAANIAQSLGFQKVITLDMGGTSTDAARFDGHFDYDYLTKIAGVEMALPCLSIETVAAGGGSICRFDGSKLCVGPESAGASPGPASYDSGGPLAITDVNLLLGKLDPSAMGIPVSREKASEALQVVQNQIFEKTGNLLAEEELLRGFEKIANEKMAEAIRKISISKGFDPKEYALLAFGGAGGLHACQIAELLGIQTVILSYDGGLLSAFGIGQAQVERFGQRQVLKNLTDCQAELPEIVASLTAEGFEKLAAEGFSAGEMAVKRCLAYLRLKGQESSLEVHFQSVAQVADDFEEKYRRLFGHFPAGRAVEVESVKVGVVASADTPNAAAG